MYPISLTRRTSWPVSPAGAFSNSRFNGGTRTGETGMNPIYLVPNNMCFESPAEERRSPPSCGWCDAQVTSLPAGLLTFPSAEVNPATQRGPRAAPCPNRPAPYAMEFHPSAPGGALSISPTFASELARDGALYHNTCRQPPTTGAAGQSREMPANAPGVRLQLIQNQIIEVNES